MSETKEDKLSKQIATLERAKKKTKDKDLTAKLESKIIKLTAELKNAPLTAKQLANNLFRARQKILKLASKDFYELLRQLSKAPEYAFLKKMSKPAIRRDMSRKAKPVGWRFKGKDDDGKFNYKVPTNAQKRKGVKDGSVYYESRVNRSDVSLVPQLAKGGETWIQDSVEEMKKKGTVGLFSKKAKAAGMSTVEYAKKVLNPRNEKRYSVKTRREAQWFKNVDPESFDCGGKMYELGGAITEDSAYRYASKIKDALADSGQLSSDYVPSEVKRVIEDALKDSEEQPIIRYYFEDEPVYAGRGAGLRKFKQGYDDRQDESLGMRTGRQSSKKQNYKARREDSYGKWGQRDLEDRHISMEHGGRQGYDDRQDESLGMRTGKESSKKQSMKARREDSYGKWGKRGSEHRHTSMEHGGRQGYNDRQDESLGMRTGKESSKKQSMKARREDSYGKWGKRGAEKRNTSM